MIGSFNSGGYRNIADFGHDSVPKTCPIFAKSEKMLKKDTIRISNRVL